MQLTDEQIIKFQKICKDCLGRKISRGQAKKDGLNFAHLIELVYRPITKEQYERFSKPVNRL